MSEFIDPEEAVKKDTRRAWKFIIAAFVLVFGVFVGLMLFYDCPPPDDSSIMPKFTESPGGFNPLAVFLDEMNANPLGREDHMSDARSRAGFQARLQSYRDHVNAQTVRLESFEKLMRSDLSMWRWPDREKMIPYLLMDRTVMEISVFFTRTLRIKARIEAEDGKIDEALKTCLQLVRFGHALEGAQGAISKRSEARVYLRAGMEALQDILPLVEANETILTEVQQALTTLEPSRADFMMTLKIEEYCVKKMIQALKKGEVNAMGSGMTPLGMEGLLLKTNLTQASKVYYTQPVMEGLESGWKEGWLASQRMKRECDVRSRNWLLFRVHPNAYGNIHTQGTVSFMFAVCESTLADVALARQVVLMLALRRYELSEGKLPDTLEPLVPKYLPAVLLDPFDDASMRWNTKSKALYSVGRNGVDDGGDLGTDWNEQRADVGRFYWWSEEVKALRESNK